MRPAPPLPYSAANAVALDSHLLLRFRIYWIDWRGEQSGAFTDVRKRDLSDAIAHAARRVLHPNGDRGALDAHGFYVRAH